MKKKIDATQDSLIERMRSFELFKTCSEDFITTFVRISTPRTVLKGHCLLNEGQVNESLLLLNHGDVEVRVNGEQVAVLNNPGGLMGEMSVLTGRAATASLVALTEVEYFEIPAKDLEPSVIESQEGFGFRLYRLISSELSDKLVRTNEKARQFEISNRKLSETLDALQEINVNLDQKVQERTQAVQNKSEELRRSYSAVEAQNSELIASHRKLEELYSTKDLTFQRLKELQDTLHPLLETLKEVQNLSNAEQQPKVEYARLQLENSIEMLRPLSDLYSSEQNIRSRRVLLIEPDRKQQVVARLALGGTGVKLDIAASREEAMDFLKTGKLVDLAFIGSGLAEMIPVMQAEQPHAKLVYMATNDIPAELPILKKYASQITNIISRNPDDRFFTVKNVSTTVSKLVSKDIFGLEKYMIWGAEVKSCKVSSSEDRASLIKEMSDHFESLGLRSGLVERAAGVAEELLMNAIYDAPTTPGGQPLFNHLSRTNRVDLSPTSCAEFRFACDGMMAGISVRDPFGRFPMQTLLNYLERNYQSSDRPEVAMQEAGKGGAGRGLHMIVENSDLVVFNVKRVVSTEVMAFFNLDTRSKTELQQPSFHFFLE